MADQTLLAEELDAAEGLLAGDQLDYALELLERLAADAEDYIDQNCKTTSEDQWYSFPTPFESLAYRRIESDPRTLHDAEEPFDRLYADYALALANDGDLEAATAALQQAVRWNPMDCGYRLDLAELYRSAGNMQEYLGLTHSVFMRASDVRHLVRAYSNFARYFASIGDQRTSAACLRAARKLDFPDNILDSMLELAKGADNDPDALSDNDEKALLGEQDIPQGANAEIAGCLLVSATTAAAKGDKALATSLTVRARDLIGAPAVKELLTLIHQASKEDAEDSNNANS